MDLPTRRNTFTHRISSNEPRNPRQQNGESGRPGKVFLVGAGPGDPDLITVKGLRCLRQADVILYDRLISPRLLEEARAHCELVYVGKKPGSHTFPQDQINALLVSYGLQGKIVVRLKGGDPFVFGRGGEEALALVEAGIPFEIVPGVSSAIAAPAYAGIPVTHREYVSSVTIVTGHEGLSASPEVDWESLAKVGGTIVVLMGVKALPNFTLRLIAGGMSPTLPAAVIQEGTTQQQRVVTGTLADIATKALEAGLSAPALTVIGTVVTAREALTWYEQMTKESR